MAVSLDEKFTNLSSVGLVHVYPNKPAGSVATNQEENNQSANYMKKYILPISMIAGGGILLYLGVRGPNKDKLFNKAIDAKLDEMKNYLNDFKVFVADTIKKSYKGADKYIDVYKSNYTYDVVPELSRIRTNTDINSVIPLHNETYDKISKIYSSEHRRQGASIFDKFLVSMDSESREISGILWNDRCNKGMKSEDLMHFIFNDYNNLDNISNAKGKLIARKYLNDLDMDNLRHQALKEALNKKSKTMAETIENSRIAYIQSKQDIMDASFDALRRILHLGEDFKPSYKNTYTTNYFDNLTRNDLMAQDLPQNIKAIFKGNPVWETVLTKDFSKLTKKDFNILFQNLTSDNSVKDIGLMIDTLRLHAIVDKSNGGNLEILYANSIAKLEYLAVKLKETGESKLMTMLSEDYFGIKPELLKGKFYYLTETVKKLGFPTVDKMKEFYMAENPNFVEKAAVKYLPLIKEQPELYFS